jgi:hypothetical protein
VNHRCISVKMPPVSGMLRRRCSVMHCGQHVIDRCINLWPKCELRPVKPPLTECSVRREAGCGFANHRPQPSHAGWTRGIKGNCTAGLDGRKATVWVRCRWEHHC